MFNSGQFPIPVAIGKLMKTVERIATMSKSTLIQKLTLTALAALGLTACSRAPIMAYGAYPQPMAAYGVQRAPLQSGMQPMLRAQNTAKSGTIQISFVKAYGRSALENEAVTRKDPNSPGAMLLRLIDGAKQTLDGSFYDIDNADVVNALIRAHKRGVRVRLTTDTDNMTAKGSGKTGPARPVIVAMQKAGIPVVDDKRSGIMHNKFMIVDGQSVWAGSTNLTDTSLFQHNNNALTLNSPELAASYTAEFERLFTHKIFGPNPPRQVPYPSVKFGNVPVEVYFSPRGGGQQAVLQNRRSDHSAKAQAGCSGRRRL
ncbi:MAG: hypothetical protein CVV27_13070 [Candidatus Melainabacteria bacterium HGW-Melainabacteria-1]|nr:MAG: hypothetical protein CVV27_13070 [Candidatus Melainabacteria bacterium HGW-Melainabacteria-1]